MYKNIVLGIARRACSSMDEEFKEFFEEHDEDMGLKALFAQSVSLETTTPHAEMATTVAEIAAKSLEMEEKEDRPEAWTRIAVM